MSTSATVIATLSDNQSAWAITLGAGFVVLLVVIVLLEMLRRAVISLNDEIWRTWLSGKAVVKNTAMTYLLKNTRDSGSELAAELDNHR